MTTCYSPVSSSVQSGSGSRPGVTTAGTGGNDTSSSLQAQNSFFDPKHFPPYSVILAITIAVGCALLILNFSIFAIFYFRRDRKREKLLNPSSNTSGEVYSRGDGSEMEELPTTPTNKFSYVNEPPELLKSNRTTASSFLQGSQTHLQSEMEALEVLELTVKQHQQELLGEKALVTMESATLHQPGTGGGFPYSYSTHTLPSSSGGGKAMAMVEYVGSCHPHQPQPHLQGIISSSPSSAASSSASTQPSVMLIPQVSASVATSTPLAVSTLPRCNGGFGLSSFIAGGGGGGTTTFGSSRPSPPPRVAGASSASTSGGVEVTSIVGVGQVGTLKKQGTLKRVEYNDNYNSDSNNESDELKV